MIDAPHALIILPRLRVESFNVASAPFTWGAPAPTAFIGLMHALERRLPSDVSIKIASIGSVVHALQTHTHQGYVRTFNLTRNPVSSAGKTKGIVEEGRASMEVSLVLGVWVTDSDILSHNRPELQAAADILYREVLTMRLAGGTIWPGKPGDPRRAQPYAIPLSREEEEGGEKAIRKFRRSMLPGSFLVQRQDWLENRERELHSVDPKATRLDAWMDAGRVRSWPVIVKEAEDEKASPKVEWASSRQKGDGWIVPIPVGFVGIGELHPPGKVKNTRDPNVSFRFVEAAYSVGEWISVHRLETFEDMLWYADTDHEAGTYLCVNDYEELQY